MQPTSRERRGTNLACHAAYRVLCRTFGRLASMKLVLQEGFFALPAPTQLLCTAKWRRKSNKALFGFSWIFECVCIAAGQFEIVKRWKVVSQLDFRSVHNIFTNASRIEEGIFISLFLFQAIERENIGIMSIEVFCSICVETCWVTGVLLVQSKSKLPSCRRTRQSSNMKHALRFTTSKAKRDQQD